MKLASSKYKISILSRLPYKKKKKDTEAAKYFHYKRNMARRYVAIGLQFIFTHRKYWGKRSIIETLSDITATPLHFLCDLCYLKQTKMPNPTQVKQTSHKACVYMTICIWMQHIKMIFLCTICSIYIYTYIY